MRTQRTTEPMTNLPRARGPIWGRRRWLLVAVAVAAVIVALSLWPPSDRDRGLEAAGRGDFDAAEPLLVRARDRDPGDVDVVRALATGYDRANRVAEAADELDRWMGLRPDDPQPVAASFRLWLRTRHFDQAASAARRWLRAGDVDPDAYPQIVAVFMLVGEAREASEAARAGLAVAPQNVRLKFQLAEALHASGQTGDARDILDRLSRDAPEFPDAWRLRGVLATEADDPAAAVRLLERAVALRPADWEARYALGLALRQCGREDDALRELDRFEKTRLALDLADLSSSQPGRVELAVRTAAAFYEAGLDREGDEFLRRALDRDPDNSEARRLRDARKTSRPR